MLILLFYSTLWEPIGRTLFIRLSSSQTVGSFSGDVAVAVFFHKLPVTLAIKVGALESFSVFRLLNSRSMPFPVAIVSLKLRSV
jgi:hypothetical protein